ncbi:MAG: helix-turn-helix domain-containing protein [Candidatus Geothermincolia bacterium]
MERTIRLLTIEDAARELEVSPETVWSYVTEGKLTASRINGRCVLSELQLLFFKNNHVQQPVPYTVVA